MSIKYSNNSLFQPEVSIILPCRNEQDSLGGSIQKIKQVLNDFNISGEIIVSDSSIDNSPEIAKNAGVVLVKHDKDGYGNACIEGLKNAKGNFLFFADPDNTYDFSEIPNFIVPLRNGADFVIGNRFAGRIEAGAMPWSHKYIGRYIFRLFIRMLFRSFIQDIHCGMRALTKDAFNRLSLRTTGMEFASEMIIKAIRLRLNVVELPINYFPRLGTSKLKTMPDGWRHLRFILLYSPMALFLWPGLVLFVIGVIIFVLSFVNSLELFNIRFQYHPLFLASLFVILGYQLVLFAFFAKTYAFTHLGEDSRWLSFVHKHVTIEKAGIIGLLTAIAGAILYMSVFCKWVQSGFGDLQEIKTSMFALTFAVTGIQTFFSAFMLSILGIKEK